MMVKSQGIKYVVLESREGGGGNGIGRRGGGGMTFSPFAHVTTPFHRSTLGKCDILLYTPLSLVFEDT